MAKAKRTNKKNVSKPASPEKIDSAQVILTELRRPRSHFNWSEAASTKPFISQFQATTAASPNPSKTKPKHQAEEAKKSEYEPVVTKEDYEPSHRPPRQAKLGFPTTGSARSLGSPTRINYYEGPKSKRYIHLTMASFAEPKQSASLKRQSPAKSKRDKSKRMISQPALPNSPVPPTLLVHEGHRKLRSCPKCDSCGSRLDHEEEDFLNRLLPDDDRIPETALELDQSEEGTTSQYPFEQRRPFTEIINYANHPHQQCYAADTRIFDLDEEANAAIAANFSDEMASKTIASIMASSYASEFDTVRQRAKRRGPELLPEHQAHEGDLFLPTAKRFKHVESDGRMGHVSLAANENEFMNSNQYQWQQTMQPSHPSQFMLPNLAQQLQFQAFLVEIQGESEPIAPIPAFHHTYGTPPETQYYESPPIFGYEYEYNTADSGTVTPIWESSESTSQMTCFASTNALGEVFEPHVSHVSAPVSEVDAPTQPSDVPVGVAEECLVAL